MESVSEQLKAEIKLVRVRIQFSVVEKNCFHLLK